MKKLLFLGLVLAFVVSNLNSQTSYDNHGYSAPEFMQAYYDIYSQNYVNAMAAGRGNTGVAKIENIENAVINPAGFQTDHTDMYVEFIIKPTKDEIGHLKSNSYVAESPLSQIGFGFNIINGLSTGIYYSQPKTLKYNQFTFSDFGTGTIINVESEYVSRKIGFVNSYHFDKLHLGVDVTYNIQSYQNMVLNGSLGKVDLEESTVGFAAGAIYEVSPKFNFGVAYTHSEEYTFESMFFSTSEPTTIPAKISAGISYQYSKDSIVNLDVDHKMNSQMNDAYEDITVIKLGLEQQIRNSIIRVGAIYIPSTFNGEVVVPTVGVDPEQQLFNYTTTETIEETDQKFLTIGYTLNMEDFTFNLSAMQGVDSIVNTTQFFISMGVNLTDFDINRYTPGHDN